jgi:hypothetical protein
MQGNRPPPPIKNMAPSMSDSSNFEDVIVVPHSFSDLPPSVKEEEKVEVRQQSLISSRSSFERDSSRNDNLREIISPSKKNGLKERANKMVIKRQLEEFKSQRSVD